MPSIYPHREQAATTNAHINSEPALDKSWREINSLNQTIIASHQNGTSIQLSTFRDREILARQHFKKHPVGPITAMFYKDKLADFFDQENTITQIQQQHKNNPLRLVN